MNIPTGFCLYIAMKLLVLFGIVMVKLLLLLLEMSVAGSSNARVLS